MVRVVAGHLRHASGGFSRGVKHDLKFHGGGRLLEQALHEQMKFL